MTIATEPSRPARRARAAAGRALGDRRLRFLIVGGFNSLFGPALFITLHFTIERTVGYLAVLTIAWILAVLEAFLGYRYFVFQVRGKFLLDLARFSALYVLLYLVNLGALPLLVQVAGLSVLLSQALTYPLIVVLSYIGNTRFAFRRVPARSAEQ